MKDGFSSKFNRFLTKLLSMKELLLVAVVIIAGIVYAVVSSFREVGVFVTTGYAIPGDAVTAGLTSAQLEAMEMDPIDGTDTIYERGGNLYYGESRKTKLSKDYPMIVSGGSALRFLNDSAVLIDSDFVSGKTYNGLLVSDGSAFNLDGSAADFKDYLFVRLPNGLFMNPVPMEVETILNLYRIPANSVLLMREDRILYYSNVNGVLLPGGEMPDLSLAAVVRVGGREFTWKELLQKLDLYKDPSDLTENGNGESEPLTESTVPTDDRSAETITGESGPEGEDEDGDSLPGGAGQNDAEGEGDGLAEGEGYGSGEDYGSADGTASGRKKKDKKGGGSGGGGNPQPGELPGSVPMPSSAETAPTTGPTEPPSTIAPSKGGKEPVKPSDKPGGAKENPDWVDPVVTAGELFVPGIYTLKTSVTIDDPAGAIIGGITYEIVIQDDYGKMTLYKRVSVTQQAAGEEMTVLLSGLKPESNYTVTGTYRYRDKYGITVKESRTFLETKAFSTKPVSELGPIKLEDLELDQALPKSNSITIPHLRCTEESDQDAIGSLAKITVRFNEGKPNARGVNMTNTQLNKLKSYQPVSFTSTKDLESATEYTIDIVCYDQFFNQLRVEDPEGKSRWTASTCYATPEADITVKINPDQSITITAKITDRDKIGYTDLKLSINNNATGELVQLNSDYPFEDIRSRYLALEDGVPVTIPSVGNAKSYTAQAWCVCDPKDGFGSMNRMIGSKRFLTASLADLGPLYVNVRDISDPTIEAEAESCETEKERTAKLKEKSTRRVITLQLNSEETNPALYTPDADGKRMVDDFTFRLAAGEEVYQISLEEEERKEFLDGETITIDTNDKVRFPSITGLTSNTIYSLSLGATHWFDPEGKETGKIVVISTLGRVKTNIRNVEVLLNDESVAFFEGFISMDIRIIDLDGVIDGNYAILRITEKETGAAVGAWMIEKNKDEWYQLRLRGSGAEAYDIKADTVYTCTFIAEEAHPEEGYQTYYVLRQFDRNTGRSLTGSIYSMGLSENEPSNDSYRAKLAYELNVPLGDDVPEAFQHGMIYVDEFRNSRDAQGGEIKEKVETIEIPFDENGLHPSVKYVPVEDNADDPAAAEGFTAEYVLEELSKGSQGRIREYDIPERYVLCEYIENLGQSYIDTGYFPNDATGIETDVYIKSFLSSYGAVFGTDSGSLTGSAYSAFFDTYVRSSFKNHQVNNSIGNSFMTRYSLRRVVEENGKYNHFYAKYGNTQKEAKETRSSYTFNAPNSLFLFAINRNGVATYPIRQKLYSFRIYQDVNGSGNDPEELQRDYIPCYDSVNAVYGLYDLKNGEFCGNSAMTGSFTGSMISSRYYYVGEDGKRYRLMEQEVPCILERQVKKNNKSTDTYSYEMYFIYAKGTSYETRVELSSIGFSTDREILTIASGEEFVAKGATDKKYVVIRDISYDNRDCRIQPNVSWGSPLNSMKADIDFQGFAFDTYTNYYTIVRTTAKTAKISNMVLRSHSGLLSVAGGRDYDWTAGGSDMYIGGALFNYFYGKAENLYIEFSQETPPFVYNPRAAYTYWSDLSPAEMEALPDDTERNRHMFIFQRGISSFTCDNYGTIENFIVDLKTEITGDNMVAGLAVANVSGGVIRNGYVFSSTGAAFGNYTGKMSLYHGWYAQRGNTNEGALSGIVGYVNTNAVVENCFALVNLETYANKEISRHAGGIAGMTTGSTGKVRNSYMIGNTVNRYLDDEGVERTKVFDVAYGPALGRVYSGGKPQNIFYISEYSYSNSVNTNLSAYALKNKVWQNSILNTSRGFVVDSQVDVGYFPQLSYTSDVMPVQHNIPLPTVSLTKKNTDVAYSYEQTDTSELSPAARAALDPVISDENFGNEAWDNPSSAYYDSNHQVACVLIAESDETRVVYSMDVDHFQLTHEDILYQYKDGSGIIQVFVKLHNPDACLSQYRIGKITYENDDGSAGDVVTLSGARYIYADYYKQIRREKKADGADSWEAMVKKYGTGAFEENLVLKEDMDFADLPLSSVLVRGAMNGKVNGAGHTIRNIRYDSNLAGTLGLGSTTAGIGLFNDLYNDVWDLTLETVQFEAGGDTAALCAHMSGAKLEHVFVKNSYISGGRLLGGIAGIVDGGDIISCGVTDTKLVHNRGAKYSAVSETGYDFFTGGITGQANGMKMRTSFVQNAYIESMYVDYATATGGLVGYLTDSYSYIDGCYATGVINSNNDFTGGLIGATRGSLMSFTNCYSDMDLYAWTYRTEAVAGILNSGTLEPSVISFGNTMMAGIYERGDADERTANMHYTDAQTALSYDSYVSGGVFDYLSTEYFSAGTDFAAGVLPQVVEEDGSAVPNQKTEYVGADAAQTASAAAGINIDSSSVVVTPLGTDEYKLEVTVRHAPGISIKSVYFGFEYADRLSGMEGKEGKVPSFTDTSVLKASSGRSVEEPDETTTSITCHGLTVDAAYDRYFVTGIEYEKDGRTAYQRVGLELTQIGQKWKTISNLQDWKTKLYGTHCENFRVIDNINFSGEIVSFTNDTANNIVNRLVGDTGAGSDYLAYRGEGNAQGTDNYRKIYNLNMNDSGYVQTSPGFWQRMYCRGLIGVINSEIGNLTFEDISVTGRYNTYGVVGALTGHAHNLNLNRVNFRMTASGSNHAGFFAYLKDGISQVYMNDCHMDAAGTVTGILAGNLFNYTHNNKLEDIFAENCDSVCSYSGIGTAVYQGIVLGLSWRDWKMKCNYTTEFTASTHWNNITVDHCSVTCSASRAGVMAGYATGELKNCTVTDCSIAGQGYFFGGICGLGGYFHATDITVEDTVVKGSGYLGAVAGDVLYYDGYYSSYNAYLNDSTVRNCQILGGTGGSASDSYLWFVGGFCGRFESSAASSRTVDGKAQYYGMNGNTLENTTVLGESGRVGGLTGFFNWTGYLRNNTVKDCTIRGKSEVGGLYGAANSGYTSYFYFNVVKNSSIVGTTHVGGLAGYGGQPFEKNRIEDCTIVGTEYNVGGVTGYLALNASGTSQSNHYSRQNSTDVSKSTVYAALVKNCSIYGSSYVGGVCGTFQSVGVPTSIVENCEIRGYNGVGGIGGRVVNYGTAGASNQLYRYAYDCTVQNSLITEMDEAANAELRTKYEVSIPEASGRKYFGGGIGYGGSLYYCLVDKCMIAAPNTDYVGALQGSYYATYYADYANSRYSVSRDCVVIGRNYVGGLYGEIRSGFNSYYHDPAKRVEASYSYSNASVTGVNRVGGIAGRIASEGGPGISFSSYNTEKQPAYSPKLTNVYFTGTLEATGTEEGSGIVAGVVADQAIATAVGVYSKVEYFQLDGAVSMPTSVTGKTVYPLLSEEGTCGLEHLKNGSEYSFITLWKNTPVVENGIAGTMGSILERAEYSGITFAPSEYSSYINSSGKRIEGTSKFVMVLDGVSGSEIQTKALRGSANYSYGKAFGNITKAESEGMMPLAKNGTSVLPFGKYSLKVVIGWDYNPDSKKYTPVSEEYDKEIRQGVYLPGSAEDAAAKEEQKNEKETWEDTGVWTGGTVTIEKQLGSSIWAYSASTLGDRLTIEFRPELFTTEIGAAGSGVYVDTAAFTTEKGREGYYSSAVTEEQETEETVPNDGDAHSFTYGYNFVDTLAVRVSYTLTSGRTGVLSFRITPETTGVQNLAAGAFRIVNGSVVDTGSGASVLPKSGIPSLNLPAGYTVREFTDLTGAQYIDTGIRCRESESYLDFCLTQRNGNMFVMGRNLADHHMLIAFDKNGKGFGYFGSAISNNFTYNTNLALGNRYMLHVSALSGDLSLDTKNLNQPGAQYINWYKGTDYNSYIGFTASGINDTILLGGGYSSYNKMKGRIYGMKIYSNGRLERDYVPCTNPSGVAGLYDLVNGTFSKSATGTAFQPSTAVGTVDRGVKQYVRLYTEGGHVYALDTYGNRTPVQ